jgi:hypothetical protein
VVRCTLGRPIDSSAPPTAPATTAITITTRKMIGVVSSRTAMVRDFPVLEIDLQAGKRKAVYHGVLPLSRRSKKWVERGAIRDAIRAGGAILRSWFVEPWRNSPSRTSPVPRSPSVIIALTLR